MPCDSDRPFFTHPVDLFGDPTLEFGFWPCGIIKRLTTVRVQGSLCRPKHHSLKDARP